MAMDIEAVIDALRIPRAALDDALTAMHLYVQEVRAGRWESESVRSRERQQIVDLAEAAQVDLSSWDGSV